MLTGPLLLRCLLQSKSQAQRIDILKEHQKQWHDKWVVRLGELHAGTQLQL
jgi:hypothetical protein